MLAKRIIPCLDVHAGRVVKGVNFLNLRDAGDPVAIAARYEEDGADELVIGHSDKARQEPFGPGVFIYDARGPADGIWTKHALDNGGIATEDLVYLLHRCGYDTGVSLDAAIDTARWLQGELGHDVPGMLVKAGGFPRRAASAA